VESRQKLRILVANHRANRVELIADAVGRLGHDVVAREIHVSEVAAVSGRLRPDLALVGTGDDPEHALKLICEIVRGAFCPVIAVLDTYDPDWIDEAARRGVYPYIVDTRPEEVRARSTSGCAATPSSRASKARSSATTICCDATQSC
jgi:AmiR/NasT family two-component response regulator